MADLVVGGALLSGFINVLFDRVASNKDVLQLFLGDKLNQKLLIELKTVLLSADALLNDAEEKQLGDNNVRNWLDELKQVLYEADHVMDKIGTEALRLKIEKDELESIARAVDSFPEEWLLPHSLTHLLIGRFDKLTALNGKGFHHLTSLQRLCLNSLTNLQCLPEEGLPKNLVAMTIRYCPLLVPRCKEGTGEDWPNIQHIPNIHIETE